MTAAASIGSRALKPNPALAPLGKLVGEWSLSGTHPYFPGAALRGRASFEWLEGGAFLAGRSEIDHPDFPDGIAIFASDDVAGQLFLLHFDERGTSRKYDVEITENEVRWQRDEPSFSQRFVLTVESDTKLSSRGEMSIKGAAWEGDLSLAYTR